MTIIEEDIKNIIQDFDFSVFEGKTVLITGATGLIGKLCTKSLLECPYDIKVLALVRNEEKAKKIFGEQKNLILLVQDINEPIKAAGCDVSYQLQAGFVCRRTGNSPRSIRKRYMVRDRGCNVNNVDYIIHTASVTASSDFVNKPVETIQTAIQGTKNVLEFARSQNLKSMVYLSSLEVYGVTQKENVKEEDYGYIDILNPRSSYSEGKKLVETMCISYGAEYDVPVKIARLAQTFGAGVSKNDNRVFAQFSKSVINKENIILHTKGETKRNYCYTTDAVRGIFTILTKGENNNAYNIANKNTYISIADMAKSLENENTKVVYEIDNKNRGYNPTVKINLDSTKLENLGWSAKVDLPEMFERTIKSMKEQG